MRWWAREAATPRLLQMASCYVGPALFVAGVRGVTSLRLAAAVVCVFGVAETVQLAARRKLPPLMAPLSILGHVLVWLPYAGREYSPADAWAHSSALLFGILGIYAAMDAWPYTLSPAVAVSLGLATSVVATA